MHRFTRTTVAFLRRLLSGPEKAPPPGQVLTASRAVAGIEALSCEGVASAAYTPSSAAAATKQYARPPLNAFGRPVVEHECSSTAGSIAAVTGMGLTGLRATAFLSLDEIGETWGPLRTATKRLVPMVVHAIGEGGHDGLHAVAEAGPFQVMAANAQEAVDLTLLSRWLTERALVPGIVAVDAEFIENCKVPDEGAIREWLGLPDEPLPCPTEAQRLLFGPERRRVAAWFDPDHPMATGTSRGVDRDRAANAGRSIFFADHVRELAEQGLSELAKLTGRTHSFVSEHRLDDANTVIVARGASVQVATAVADHLREANGPKVGVLGITFMRPFPAAEVAKALKGRSNVIVIDVVDGAMEAPLLREVRAAASASNWTSALTAGVPSPAELAKVVTERPSKVRMGLAAHSDSGLPRRDALVHAVVAAYPEAKGATPDASSLEATAGVVGLTEELGPDLAPRVGEILVQRCGAKIRGSSCDPEAGVVLAAGSPGEANLGSGAKVKILVVASDAYSRLGRPLLRVSQGGKVFFATDSEPATVWNRFPEHWRDAVRKANLDLQIIDASWEVVLDFALGGEQEGIATRALGSQSSAVEDLPLPALVRKVDQVRTAPDNLPRFWGQVVRPDRLLATGSTVDPIAAAGAVPASSSALDAPSAATGSAPSLDASACTGCGECWQACPDSSIAVTAIGIEGLLDAASRQAETSGKIADALRRSHKHIAARLAKEVDAGVLSEGDIVNAWGWLAKKMSIPEAERPEYGAHLTATIKVIRGLEPIISAPFFTDRDKSNRETLVLAIDPRTCQDCGLCAAVCEPGALSRVPRNNESMLARYSAWEGLPDTTGASISAAEADIGSSAATLLSRHCAQALIGGGAGTPGSGARLGARLVVASVEREAQEQLAGLAGALAEKRDNLWAWVRGELADNISDGTDLQTFAAAEESLVRLERPKLARATKVAAAADAYHTRLVSGTDGLGRARFGVVTTGGAAGDWASRYPHHPFHAPLTIAPTETGAELALGVAAGLVADHIELVRTIRRATVLARPPSDLPGRLETIALLTWQDLTEAERASCTPLLLMANSADLSGAGLGVLTRLLTSDLPIKVLLLDGRGDLNAVAEPSLVALAHRSAYVAAVSVGHADHLGQAVRGAMQWAGPAFIHLHAPSPSVHGFPTHDSIDQARRAVACRGHVLLTWDPSRDGNFGTKLSLDGNPEADSTSFSEWAATEARFGDPALQPLIDRAAERRASIWSTFQELTADDGASAAETEREEAIASMASEHERAIVALKAEQVAAVSAAESGHDELAVSRLTDRLMQLAGYADNGASR